MRLLTRKASQAPGASVAQVDRVASVGIGVLVAVRLAFAREDFSYDYVWYLGYLRVLTDYRLAELMDSFRDFAPFVSVGSSTFEVGFVAVAKVWTLLTPDATLAYAGIAASAVAIRIYSMRALACPWYWIALSQIYAITVLDANAVRAGLAVSVLCLGLVFVHRGRSLLGLTIVLAAGLLHLQALLFGVPFLVVYAFAARAGTSRVGSLGLGAAALAVSITGLFALPSLDIARLAPYLGEASLAGGFNVTSLLAASVISLCFVLRPSASYVAETLDAAAERRFWLAAISAVVPSFVLFVANPDAGALGDRAWQFSFVTLLAVVWTPWADRKVKIGLNTLLFLLLLVSVVNVTVRYPLSNFFDFILPHQFIIPLYRDLVGLSRALLLTG